MNTTTRQPVALRPQNIRPNASYQHPGPAAVSRCDGGQPGQPPRAHGHRPVHFSLERAWTTFIASRGPWARSGLGSRVAGCARAFPASAARSLGAENVGACSWAVRVCVRSPGGGGGVCACSRNTSWGQVRACPAAVSRVRVPAASALVLRDFLSRSPSPLILPSHLTGLTTYSARPSAPAGRSVACCPVVQQASHVTTCARPPWGPSPQ